MTKITNTKIRLNKRKPSRWSYYDMATSELEENMTRSLQLSEEREVLTKQKILEEDTKE